MTMNAAELREYHRAPDGAVAAGPSKEEMATCIRELLDCYWGEGDGAEPPEFIRRADLIARYFDK